GKGCKYQCGTIYGGSCQDNLMAPGKCSKERCERARVRDIKTQRITCKCTRWPSQLVECLKLLACDVNYTPWDCENNCHNRWQVCSYEVLAHCEHNHAKGLARIVLGRIPWLRRDRRQWCS